MKYLIVALSVLFSGPAFCAVHTGEVIGYLPYSSAGKEILVFKLSNNVSGGCNSSARFAIDDTSLRYKNTVSAVMAAFHSKTTIKVDYLSTCNAWGNSADIAYICVGEVGC